MNMTIKITDDMYQFVKNAADSIIEEKLKKDLQNQEKSAILYRCQSDTKVSCKIRPY